MKKVDWTDIPCIVNGEKITLTTTKDVTSEDIENTLQLIIETEEKRHGKERGFNKKGS